MTCIISCFIVVCSLLSSGLNWGHLKEKFTKKKKKKILHAVLFQATAVHSDVCQVFRTKTLCIYPHELCATFQFLEYKLSVGNITTFFIHWKSSQLPFASVFRFQRIFVRIEQHWLQNAIAFCSCLNMQNGEWLLKAAAEGKIFSE